MNTANLQFLSILLISDSAEAPAAGGADYQQVLESVRTSIASAHADELSAALDNAEAAQTLKNLIYKYASDLLAGSIGGSAKRRFCTPSNEIRLTAGEIHASRE